MKLLKQNSLPFLAATAFIVILVGINAFNQVIRLSTSARGMDLVFLIIELLIIALNIAALYERLWGYVALFFNVIVLLGISFLLIALHAHEQGSMLNTMIGLTFLANCVYFYEMIFRKVKRNSSDMVTEAS